MPRLIERMFTTATTIRRFEETVADLVSMRRIEGIAHLSIGQEAVAVAVCAALRPDDTIASTHRGHGHLIAKGGDLARCSPSCWDGRPATVAAGAARCTSPTCRSACWARTASSGPASRWRSARRSPTSTRGRTVSVAFFGDGAMNSGGDCTSA